MSMITGLRLPMHQPPDKNQHANSKSYHIAHVLCAPGLQHGSDPDKAVSKHIASVLEGIPHTVK
jgi:hypothetical protein